jgi:Cu2+-containing amine oxidase
MNCECTTNGTKRIKLENVSHPCEPLSHDELLKAVEIIKSYSQYNSTTRFISISLHEPLKSDVFEFIDKHKTECKREARAVLLDNR